jgi:hypothetical protein
MKFSLLSFIHCTIKTLHPAHICTCTIIFVQRGANKRFKKKFH